MDRISLLKQKTPLTKAAMLSFLRTYRPWRRDWAANSAAARAAFQCIYGRGH